MEEVFIIMQGFEELGDTISELHSVWKTYSAAKKKKEELDEEEPGADFWIITEKVQED